ncbi:MAG: hypothetical protein J6T81_07880 [Bacteroidales bacterium]|nr:hypothetical protein [Bacteroidales bacterium]
MKTNLLKMRRVLSATLLVLLLNVVGMTNAFAQTQVATLQHNDTISMYYGQNALVEAYTASADGDVITLSSGTFTTTGDIMKSIILRGAGCVADTATNTLPTIIPGTIKLQHCSPTIEGIVFSGTIVCYIYGNSNMSYKPTFIKCSINEIRPFAYGQCNRSCQCTDCIVKNFDFAYMVGAEFINSVVYFSNYVHDDIYNLTSVYNSLLVFPDGKNIKNLIAYNSIIVSNNQNVVDNCTFNNCIGIKLGDTSIFEGQANASNMEVNNYSDVFETFNGTVSFDENYNLKNDIIDTFLGNDGTQVGIYGGMMPYNPRPTYMKIKRCNVASRSTIDGKLSVDIEIINEDN